MLLPLVGSITRPDTKAARTDISVRTTLNPFGDNMSQHRALLGDRVERLGQLASAYVQPGQAPEAADRQIRAFYEEVRSLPVRDDIVCILGLIQTLDVEDPLKTFVERSVLTELASSAGLTMSHVSVLFECEEWEALKALSRNPHIDEFTRERARIEADQIMRAGIDDMS